MVRELRRSAVRRPDPDEPPPEPLTPDVLSATRRGKAGKQSSVIASVIASATQHVRRGRAAVVEIFTAVLLPC